MLRAMSFSNVLRPVDVLSYALAFVVSWFGINEILSPVDWVTFAPSFLGGGALATDLVVFHGIILTTCAILLVFNYYRWIAASVLVLVFAEVITELIVVTGLSDLAVRDIGLGGTALGIVLLSRPKRK